MIKPSIPFLVVVLAVSALALTACGSDDEGASTESAGPALHVVATTTQAADLVRNVGGKRIEVTQLLSANADPHGYELRPRDVAAITDADLVVRSGGDLDDWLEEAVQESGGDAEIVTLIDAVETIEGGHGHEEEEGDEHAGEEDDEHAGEEDEEHAGEEDAEHEIDPHWWQDPRNAVVAVGEIEQALSAADPRGATAYADQAESYRARIEALDTAVSGCWDAVPRDERKLVTTHDSLGYYADRYDLEVVGTVIPSLSTQGQASAGEVAELVDTIRREGVNVVFAESSINSKVERAIAQSAGAKVGEPLWADTLGPDGSDGDTYLKSIASNTRAMIDGVTGSAGSCTLPSG